MLSIKVSNLQVNHILLKHMGVKQVVALGLLGVSLTSQAALFDDKEARKKILEVETKSLASDQSHDNAINELKKNQAAIEKRLAAIEAVIQGQGLADMQNQIEQMKQELAQVKGDLEVAVHNLEETQQRQKDLYSDTDTRLRKIEGGAVPDASSATSMPVAAEEKDVKALAEAEALSKTAKHKEAFTAYDLFLKDYPTSKLTPDALYGMGYSQFALKNYKSAIATQQKLVDGYAGHAKVPEAMYNIANSQIQLGQVSNAKKTLKDLIALYPAAEIIPSAQKRLKALDALK